MAHRVEPAAYFHMGDVLTDGTWEGGRLLFVDARRGSE